MTILNAEENEKKFIDFITCLLEKKLLYKEILAVVEKPLFEQILKKTKGNQLKTSRALGLNRNTVRAKIRKLGIDIEKWKNIQ